jgi:hypothetical protein
MAPRKAKNTIVAPKARAQSRAQSIVTERRSSREPQAAATNPADLGRLLREAAWSRMFGRVESKNPFAR